MRFKDAKWKAKEVGACYYQVQNPDYYYKQGIVNLVLTQKDDDVDIYVNSGSDVRNCSDDLGTGNSTVPVGSSFSINQSSKYIITVVPRRNSFNTTFAFKFDTVKTVDYPWYEFYYYQFFVKPRNGQTLLIISAVVAGLLLILFFTCIGCAIKMCCCKR